MLSLHAWWETGFLWGTAPFVCLWADSHSEEHPCGSGASLPASLQLPSALHSAGPTSSGSPALAPR